MVYRITSKDKFFYLYRHILASIVIGFICLWVVDFNSDFGLVFFIKAYLGLLLCQFILFILPAIILYKNYSKRDLHASLTIENDGEMFFFENAEIEFSFSKREIEKVIYYLTPPLYEDRMTWVGWDSYFYSKVITSKGTFIISCLLINNLEDYIDDDLSERRKVLFPLIKN